PPERFVRPGERGEKDRDRRRAQDQRREFQESKSTDRQIQQRAFGLPIGHGTDLSIRLLADSTSYTERRRRWKRWQRPCPTAARYQNSRQMDRNKRPTPIQL